VVAIASGVALLALAVLWLVSLVDVLTTPDGYRNGTQLIWVLVLLLSGPVGAVLYQCLGPDRVHLDPDREPLPPGHRARRQAIADPWSDAAPR
jgi:hypothetical protein